MLLPENGRVEFSVPHAEVLKRVCLLVSHAGHGVVLKAMSQAVERPGNDQLG
jgi:UDP:flavonoid glycosyltransferase YjiC (YdhE family)